MRFKDHLRKVAILFTGFRSALVSAKLAGSSQKEKTQSVLGQLDSRGVIPPFAVLLSRLAVGMSLHSRGQRNLVVLQELTWNEHGRFLHSTAPGSHRESVNCAPALDFHPKRLFTWSEVWCEEFKST